MNRRRGAGAVWRQINMSLWLWPGVAVVVAYVFGLWVSRVQLGSDSIAGTLFQGDGSAGRSILTALVGGLVTALSVIFSLTITGLQLVHQQYSPRLLRNFIRDRSTKVTLGVFAGTVAYILAVLQSFPPSDSPEPVPRLAIFLGMVLFMACVGAVAYFAQHITQSIRVHKTMDRVAEDSRHAIRLSNKAAPAQAHTAIRAPLPQPPDHAVLIDAWRSGYVREIDVTHLADRAGKAGATLRMRPMIGDHVIEGMPLAWYWSRGEGDVDATVMRRELRKAVEIGEDRSEDTDVSYGFRQLVDVAVRAMSPSLNDPYTAIQAIDHMTVLLCGLARSGMPDGVVRDADGALLVAVPGADLADYLRLAIDQPCRYGGGEPAVAVRLLKMLSEVGALAPSEARQAIEAEIDRVSAYASSQMNEHDDLTSVQEEAAAARAALNGQTPVHTSVALRM